MDLFHHYLSICSYCVCVFPYLFVFFDFSLDMAGQVAQLKDRRQLEQLIKHSARQILTACVPIQLIDFGRAIDLSCVPAGSVFMSSSDTEAFMCHEMLNNQPWRHQVDMSTNETPPPFSLSLPLSSFSLSFSLLLLCVEAVGVRLVLSGISEELQ